MSHPALPVFAGALVAVASLTAHAERAAVLVTGKTAPAERSIIATAAQSAAKSLAWDLVDVPVPEGDAVLLADCLHATEIHACIDPIAGRLAVARFIFIRAEHDRAGLTITEEIVLAGAQPSTDSRYCASCTDQTLTKAAFDLTVALLREAQAETARTRIAIRSKPAGAWITIDGVHVGTTDRVYPTYPGHHVVLVHRDGFADEIQAVDVVENTEKTVSFDLAPASADRHPEPDPSPGHPYLVPVVVTAVGVAGIAVGIGLQVAADPSGAHDQPKHLISGPGIATMAAGAVVTGIGGYLVARAHRRSGGAPTIALSAGGVDVGWATSF